MEDLILDREELNLLKTLNNFVNVPALKSKAMRIICDEELEIRDDETPRPQVDSEEDEEVKESVEEDIEEDIQINALEITSNKKSNGGLFDYTVKTNVKPYQFSQNRLPGKGRKQLKTHKLQDISKYRL